MTPEQKSMMQGWLDQKPTLDLLRYINQQRADALVRAIAARYSEDTALLRMELETIHRYNQLFDTIRSGEFIQPTETQPE